MNWKKKAAISMMLVTIILTLVSFGILALSVSKAMTKGDDIALEQACRRSIDLRASSVVWAESAFFDNKLNLVPQICTNINKELKGSKEEVMEDFADMTARCWWMFAEGRYDEILTEQQGRVADMMGFEKIENDCFICYSVIIDQDEFDDGDTQISQSEYLDYLLNNNYRKVAGNYSYIDYIQEYGGYGRFASLISGDGDNINDWNSNIQARGAYAVTFLAKNAATEASVEGGILHMLGALGGTAGVGATVFGLGAATKATGGTIALFGGPVGWAIGGTIIAVGTLVSVNQAANGISEINIATTKAGFYNNEREVSSIYIDDLRSAQAKCATGDLGGK